MTTSTTRTDDFSHLKTCGQCEYFDREFGDCLGPNSPRFQTEANSPACFSFFPDTSAEGDE